MCGRFAQKTTYRVLKKLLGVTEVPPVNPRYNIAPTQEILNVRQTEDGGEAILLKWEAGAVVVKRYI